MAGIENIKNVFRLLFAVIEDTMESLDDGEISVRDSMNFFDSLQALIPALSGISSVGKEFADLDDSEKKELKSFITGDFDIENDKVEIYVEKFLHGVLVLSELIPLYQSIKQAKV